ncbi:MAG: outer membrane protein assembly factor BamA [Bacteroidales bacterium]|jgi:outer membrane protein insertion porin family|nr:outer membrane protein assembly factor BamA [Bacteroidales bacterium]
MLKNYSIYILFSFFVIFCSIESYTQEDLPYSPKDSTILINYNEAAVYEIGGITTSGSANFDPRMLLFAVGERIEIPGDKISKSIKRLWETGLYEEIDIAITRIMDDIAFLDVYLVERSRLVAYGFSGINKSDETEVRAKIKIAQGNIVNDNLKRTCTNIIKDYFIGKGFYNVSVSVREEPDKKVANGVNLFFNIDKGKKVKIAEITINGNQKVSKSTLTRAMKETKERSRFMPFYKADTVIAYMFKNPDYYKSKDILEHASDYFGERVKLRIFKSSKFVESSYETDKNNLVSKYNDLGFRDAYIESDSIVINKNNMYININVNEGDKYYFRNITFVGNTKYKSEALSQLLRIEKGDVYNQSRLTANLTMNETGNDISSLYMNDGYLFFYANPVEVLIENDSIDIEIRIIEGKQARYNKILVSGNTKTNDNVIIRELTTIPGQMFNRADIIRTQQVLLSLGYFDQEKMQVLPKPNEADGTVDIEYVVEETSSDQFELSAGYGGGTFLLSAGLAFNNFSFKKMFTKEAWRPIPSGDGQRLALRVSTNVLYYQYYSLSFSEPWLGGKKPNSLSVSVYYQNYRSGSGKRGESAYSAIDIIGANVSFGKKLKWPDDYFQVSHSLIYQHYRVTNYSGVFSSFSDGYSNSFSYMFAIGRSSVNAPIYPREGSDILFSFQLTPPFSLLSGKDFSNATAQEKYKYLEFYKWKFNVSWYTKVIENLVLNVRMKTGFMGYYNADIGAAPFERFYLGGDGLSTYQYDGREVIGMRGYDDSDFTPANGATIFNKFTAELRYPVSLNPAATIYLLTFVEAGNAWTDFKEYSPFKLYKSAGVGVRINLPMFGLLGFDWGYGFDKLPGATQARGGKFHISINSSID